MNMYANDNGTKAAEMEFEASHYSNPEMEDEWEMQEATHYSNPEMEDEWEMQEAAYPEMANEWEMQEAAYPEMANEWEMQETSHYSNPELMEDEWEMQEAAHYSNPEMEDEWEMQEATHYSNPEMEADRFFPLIAKLGAKLLPKLGKFVSRGVKRLIPRGRQMVSRVVRNVQRPTMGGRQLQSSALSRINTARELVERLRGVLSEGESEAAALEAEFFGANEFEGELATHEIAHEAALTEVLAAEAAHTESESEAEALLGAALPITIQIMDRGRTLRQATPALVRANAQLVRSLHHNDPTGRQLLRATSSIHRRTIASLLAAQRAGRPITSRLVSRVMAAQAARVLGTSQILGRALMRNFAIRQGTVAPVRQSVQPRRMASY